MKKIKIKDILKKKNKEKITVLTGYDYSFAKILDQAGIDIILVGDSMANVALGMKEIRNIPLAEMFNHTAAVARGVTHSLIVADMPYKAYQKDPAKCLYNAKKFIKAGADAVKIEWFSKAEYVIKRLIKNKIPVMGHIGLTPQTAHLLGGYKVQGRDQARAEQLIEQAKTLQNLGVFSIVFECIPYQLSSRITKTLKIPTIGIGAGKYCDGQVLVLYDFLGLYKAKKLKFTRVYCDLSSQIQTATAKYIRDVRLGRFPSKKESFSLKREK